MSERIKSPCHDMTAQAHGNGVILIRMLPMFSARVMMTDKILPVFYSLFRVFILMLVELDCVVLCIVLFLFIPI